MAYMVRGALTAGIFGSLITANVALYFGYTAVAVAALLSLGVVSLVFGSSDL